eukprot:Skav203047  [mRNA]  locus=scaffold845:104797:123156:+ [translate_table: standard]
MSGHSLTTTPRRPGPATTSSYIRAAECKPWPMHRPSAFCLQLLGNDAGTSKPVVPGCCEVVDTLLFAVLNSRSHLQRHGRDKGAQDLVRGLRMAATELLMNIIDLEAALNSEKRVL